jgi:thioredoxin-related protein
MRNLVCALLALPLLALAGVAGHAPRGTFTDSFLVLPEDVRDAARAGRRVVLFFEQEGCPACLRMARVTFADPAVAERLRRRFVMIALDIFGAREVTWTDGRTRREKALAAELDVRGTPTVLILDERGQVIERFVGYRDPQGFGAILDAAAPKQERGPQRSSGARDWRSVPG